MAGLCCLEVQELLVVLLGFLLVCYLIRARVSNKPLPPGPSAWSQFADLFSPDRTLPHVQLEKHRRRYGNVTTLYILWTPVILLSGLQTIQEALIQRSRAFAGRPRTRVNDFLSKFQGIISAPYGKAWKQQRRFTLTILRNFGLGKITLEEKILEEAEYLTDTLKASLEGQPVDARPVITSAVSNVTCTIIFGRRFHYDDKTFTHLVGLYDEMLKLHSSIWMPICLVLPIIIYLPGPHQRIFENQAAILAILQGFIDQHRQTLSGETIRDFIDAYLLEMEKERDGPPGSTLTEGNLLYDIHDLFLGGTETTTTTLCWGLLYMMAYPEIQVKCQKEIDKVIGRSRRPSMQDSSAMPYVSAVIHEVQRYANILPVSVARATTQDTPFMGYTIKKVSAPASGNAWPKWSCSSSSPHCCSTWSSTGPTAPPPPPWRACTGSWWRPSHTRCWSGAGRPRRPAGPANEAEAGEPLMETRNDGGVLSHGHICHGGAAVELLPHSAGDPGSIPTTGAACTFSP
ncbi:cytochrome P450 2J2-like isoform X1 [Rhinoraja longicauda]